MDLSVLISCIRFISLFFSVFFSASPGIYVFITLFSTVLYSTLISLIPQTSSGIIFHRCINQVPSTILLLFTASYEPNYRFVFLIFLTFQYFAIWISVYTELLTKEHRKQVLSKGPLMFPDEFCWALHDGFLLTHILVVLGFIQPEGLVRSAYNLFMAGFFARYLLDFINFAQNILDIVEIEPKKNN